MKFLLPALLLLFTLMAGCNRAPVVHPGRWVSVQDPLSELHVDKDMVSNVYHARPVDTLTYEITRRPCDSTWKAASGTRFIRWSDGICHEIVTLNDSVLELIYTGNGKTQTYRRKP